MNRALLSLLLLLVANAALVLAAPENYASKWVSAKSRYGLKFDSVEAERNAFNTYAKNMEMIETHNAMGNLGYQLSENQFTHIEYSELQKTLLISREQVQAHKEQIAEKIGATTTKKASTTTKKTSTTTKKTSTTTKKASTTTKKASTTTTKAPTTVSSDTYLNYTNLFPPIKNQGSCGSCYTFSSTAIVEAQYALKYNQVISLSEEHLLDCTYAVTEPTYDSCEGGLTEDCLKNVINSTGVVYTSAYPYVGKDTTCPSLSTAARVKTRTWGRVYPTYDQAYLKTFLKNNGPLSIYIHATTKFMSYSSGIFQDSTCSTNAIKSNHAVTLVGYGTENGQDYWLVRNSWGTSWGLKGYVKIIRNTSNDCLVSSWPIYVKL